MSITTNEFKQYEKLKNYQHNIESYAKMANSYTLNQKHRVMIENTCEKIKADLQSQMDKIVTPDEIILNADENKV